MARKRLTERFPFLLPLRRWQRKRCFYLKMYFDGCRYAAVRTKTPLEYTLFRANVAMRNERSGFPMEYQQNKVHNLRLAAEAMNGVVLHPSEMFSFWRLARRADRHTPYKDGLVLVNGSVRPAYGGGLCMLSDLLYWCFLHTPLTVTERHGHAVEQFPAAEAERFPRGADATVSEAGATSARATIRTCSFASPSIFPTPTFLCKSSPTVPRCGNTACTTARSCI